MVAGTGGGWSAGAGQEKRFAYEGVPVRPPADRPPPLLDQAPAPHGCLRQDISAVDPAAPDGDQDCRTPPVPVPAHGLLTEPARPAPVPPSPPWPAQDAVAPHQAPAATDSQNGAPDNTRDGDEDDGPRTDVVGYAFDRCSAPPDSAMQTWAESSPYRAVGVYIGGPSQACASPDRDWVDARNAEGWGFLPIYVGHQAARGRLLVDADQETARQQGSDAADDAVRKAEGLGFQPGAVLYNDMENYESSVYRDRVLAYLAGWTDQLHAHGYRSGVYTGAASGVRDLAGRWDDDSYPEPDVLWAAAWNSHHDVTDDGMGLPDEGRFTGGRRAHQYLGDTTEEYGGVGMTIDASYLDVTSPAGDDGRLRPGERLAAGRSVGNNAVELTMQDDGDLTVRMRGDGRLLWSAGIGGHPGAYAVQQDDGNLVLYAPDGGPGVGGALWATGTWNCPGAFATLQDDGNFVLYRRGGGPETGGAVWATATWGFSPH
ncbi:glycoside hydrolase domain-containing protein [Kitasatospora sp. NPDC051984]|uniref:glycoside hydrolase domain-containing protein n=1 Tax=Kitasatospora sp. NPDC051984 TaxID=3364059 RepID=UPI0037C88C64